MNKLVRVVFLLLCFVTLSFSSSKDIENIPSLIAKSLFELDKDSLNNILNSYLNDKENIISLEVIDLSYDEVYWSYFKNKINIKCSDELFKTYPIKYEEKTIGRLDVCYSTLSSIYNEKERKWLEENPLIRIAKMNYWPVDINDKNVHIDYINLLSRYGQLNISLLDYSNWSEGFSAAVEGNDVYGILNLSFSEERSENKFDYVSHSYFYTPMYIIVKKENTDIKDIKDLENKSVFVKKDEITNQIIKQLDMGINSIVLQNDMEMVKELSKKNSKADVMITYVLDKNLLYRYGLKVAKEFYNKYGEVHLGVSKKHSILKSILEKAHDKIPKAELLHIQKKVYKSSNGITLLNSENKWLENNKNLTFAGEPNWMPFESFDEKGKYIGYVSEYLKKFEDVTNIKIKKIKTKGWSETLKIAKKNEVDIISGDVHDEVLNKYYNPIKPYLESDIVIVMDEKTPYIENLNAISNKKIAIIKDYGYRSELLRKYPKLNFYDVANVKEGLEGVATKKYDAIVGTVALMSYSIKTYGYENLRIVGNTDMKMNLTLFVKKGEDILFNILDKYMSSITDLEHFEIKNKYSNINFRTIVDYTMIWYIIFIALILLLITGFYNRRLKILVNIKTYQLKDLNKNLEKKVKLRTKELNDEKNRAIKLNEDLELEKNHAEELNEELKVAKEEAENVAKQKSEFLANMSHEIRTPMNSVIGFTEILDKEITNPVQREYLTSIKKGGQALLRIINDILDLSKIEAGKLEIRNEPLNPKSLFVEIESIFHSKIIAKNINFNLEIDEKLPQYVILDGVRLRQILFNLIGNAIKFTEKGHITLKVENIIKEDKTKVDLVFSVEDTGIGIDKKNLQTIFNAFEQQKNQDVAKYGGTGLGLAICNKLIQMMNGQIEVDSKKGVGTKFTVKIFDVFVGNDLEEETVDKFKTSQIEFESCTILVVDDIVENRKLVKAALKDYDIKLIMAENGQEALDKLKTINVDLILMDLRMPVMNGYEATLAIKSDEKLSSTPVIALTASVMGRDLEKVEQYGFDGYLRKPVILEDLLKKLSEYIKYHFKEKENIIEENIENIDISTYKEVVKVLDGEYKEEWLRIKDSGDFSLIEDFANKLLELTKTKKINLIENYANELLNSIDAFDIEKMDFMINSYLDLSESLRSKY